MKKIIVLFLTFFLCMINISAIDINSKYAILYNLDDDMILYEKGAQEKTQIASLTKIVTAITVIDYIDNLNDLVIITDEMLSGLDGYAKVGLQVGDQVSYIDLLYALMLPSGADAAQALAIATSGSISQFADLMNAEVAKIGAFSSHFSNPVGMDDVNNYSTTYDLAQILKYSLDHELFRQIYMADTYEIVAIHKTVQKTTIQESGKYNLDISIINGSKTGYTDEAGFCLSSIATINGVNYLLVTLNADTSYPYHLKDAIDLYHYYSTNYSYQKIISENQLLAQIKIKDSRQKYLDIYANKDIILFLENFLNLNDLQYEYVGIDEITKNIKVGELLGYINVMDHDNVLYTYDVYLNDTISYYHYFLYIVVIMILLLTLFILWIIGRRLKRRKLVS